MPVNDPLHVKALVLSDGTTSLALITVDAVALAEIGWIKTGYVAAVRSQIERELKIKSSNVLINASHCHGVVRSDVAERTLQAVRDAARNMVPVDAGTGRGHEDRIMENRRLRLKNGREADVRHAYSMPPEQEVMGVGPVDPQIGILRLDRKNGQTLAVIYNFAMHPIQGVPNGGNTADVTGFASKAIEESLGYGAMAFFLQGCAGDINPVMYKAVDHPRDAEPLGNMLGLSVLRALKQIRPAADAPLQVINETMALPRADLAPRISSLQAEQAKLVRSFKGTTLNLKTFLELMSKYSLASDFPSYYSHSYLHDKMIGRGNLSRLDAENRKAMAEYIRNIYTMEEVTRNQENLNLLTKHQAANHAAGNRTIDAEVMGVRVGQFVLVTFPGEPTVQIGLNIKKASPHEFTFVAGYTNGYLYYAPTAEQLKNVGGAQEDSDCLLTPEWQAAYEAKAHEILGRL